MEIYKTEWKLLKSSIAMDDGLPYLQVVVLVHPAIPVMHAPYAC